MASSEVLRRRLVRLLSDRGAITSGAVRRAFLDVPREVFLPEVVAGRGLDAIYRDEVFVSKTDSRGQAISSSSQPGIMAPMLEHLELAPGQRVLEIGAGTGYNAALLKSIVGARGRVTTVEIDADTTRRARAALRRGRFPVKVVHGDGMKGWRDGAPYDRIVATASSSDIPRTWFDQLARGGLLELPLRLTTQAFGPQIVATFVKEKQTLRSVRSVPGGFMTIRDGDGSDAAVWESVAMQVRVGAKTNLVALSGQMLGRLSDPARRRLIGVLAGRPRKRVLFRGSMERAGGAALYVALAVRSGRRVDTASWWGTAIVDPAGTGVAALAPRGDVRTSGERATLESLSFGNARTERELLRLVDEWRAMGRPSWRDLQIVSTYGERPAGAWRTRKVGRSYLSFDWSVDGRLA